jgi:5-methylcytosine-specific restriction endonuclease McrA
MKVLLLNSTYQAISFVSERKALKLFVKEKIEVLSSWNDKYICWSNGKMNYPAVIRLKYYVRWIPRKTRFNRSGVFRRDKNMCMYCGKTFRLADLTIDHIVPQSKGGKSNWHNCVASCFYCNNKKKNRTPEEARMPLLVQPVIPGVNVASELNVVGPKHEDWPMYLGLT